MPPRCSAQLCNCDAGNLDLVKSFTGGSASAYNSSECAQRLRRAQVEGRCRWCRHLCLCVHVWPITCAVAQAFSGTCSFKVFIDGTCPAAGTKKPHGTACK